MTAGVDVVVVGAGLAGLCATRALVAADLDVALLEASDDVGGRIRTDLVDGFRIDRGFQVYNPAYPEAAAVLDHDALDLRGFTRGLLVHAEGRVWRLADPRSEPTWLVDAVQAPLGSTRDRVRAAAWALQQARRDPSVIVRQPDGTSAQRLRDLGVSPRFVDRVLRPFLAGVFLEDELSTSARFLDLVVRTFVRGTPAVPALGMHEIPRQLAARLPDGVLRLVTPATAVSSDGSPRVTTSDGVLRSRGVVVATDPSTAGSLLPGLAVPAMHATTSWNFATEDHALTYRRPVLVVDADRTGPVVNSVVLTHASPSYASDGRALVVASTLGTDASAEQRRRVRDQLQRLHRTSTAAWDEVAVVTVPEALPAMAPPHEFRRPVRLGDGIYVAGDHRDSASIQGAMVSGRRAADAVLHDLLGDQTEAA